MRLVPSAGVAGIYGSQLDTCNMYVTCIQVTPTDTLVSSCQL